MYWGYNLFHIPSIRKKSTMAIFPKKFGIAQKQEF